MLINLWKIDHKVLTLTVNNASYDDVMVYLMLK